MNSTSPGIPLAGPTTSLPADLRELDTELNPDDIYTHCNIGEIFPGVMTPLTWSASMRANDKSMQRMYRKIATLEKRSEEPFLIVQSFGRPLLNLSQLTAIARSMGGGSETSTMEAICGRAVSGIVVGPRAPQSERLRNGLRYVSFMLFGQHVAKMDRLVASTDLTPGKDASTTYAIIDRELPKISEAWYLHEGCSLLPGSIVGALPRILAKGKVPTEEDNAEVARLLAGAENVESVDIAAGIDRIVSALVDHDGSELNQLLELDAHAADNFLRHTASAPARHEYDLYLKRHGHRCVREVELREKEWAEDPTPVVKAVQSGIRAKREGHVGPSKAEQPSVPLTLRPLVSLGRRSIRNRERTKSQVVMMHVLFKRAYRALGRQMVNEGLLPEDDLVFFLQHAELGTLLRDHDSTLVNKALARREVLPYQMKLVFRESYRGCDADPIDPPLPDGQGILHGKPVSRGVVRGRARVAQTPTEASEVQPDEVLIVPVVDVGWTPVFATISGFAADVGAALSHGSVVAREYGIPTIVNLRKATVTFRTGDLVELDANRGILRRVSVD